MDALITALTTSVLGTFRVFVILLAGILASKWPRKEPLLTREACRCFSRACAFLFLPSLMISSVGATLNPTALTDAWQLVVAGSFTIGTSAIVARVVERLFFRRPEDRRAFRPVGLAITFANSGAFPLLLMDALCEQDYINSDFDGDAVECFTQATGMIFIYLVVWQAYFFGWGFYVLGQDDALERKLTGRPVKNRPTPETAGGVGDDSSLRRDSPSVPPPRAMENHGNDNGAPGQENIAVARHGVVAIEIESCDGGTSRETAAAVNVASGDVGGSGEEDRRVGVKQRIRRILVSPNIISVTIGVVISMIAPLQEMMFDNPRAVLRPLGAALQTVGTPEVAVSTLVMAGSLVQVPNVAASLSASAQGSHGDVLKRWRRFRFLVGFLHVVCRLIVVPAVGFAVFWAAKTQSSVMGENRLMHLVLLIEFAMPSAAFIIVSLNQLRLPATAGFMARLYLWQYGASMFTITAWTALAVHLVY